MQTKFRIAALAIVTLVVVGCTEDTNKTAPMSTFTGSGDGTMMDDNATDDAMAPAVGPDGKPMDQNMSPESMSAGGGEAEVQEVE